MIIIDILLLHKAPFSDYDSGSLPFANESRVSDHKNYKRRASMKNPLDSLWGTVISGFVLTLVLLVIVTKFIGV